MPSQEKFRELESPFIDDELFSSETEDEWEPRLPPLQSESPFVHAFEGELYDAEADLPETEEFELDEAELDIYEDEGWSELEENQTAEDLWSEQPDTEELELWEGEINRTTSTYIKWVQQSLNRLLGIRLAVDGITGTRTRTAIRSFQKKQGLTSDGIVDRLTEEALIAGGAGPPPDGTTPAAPALPTRTTTRFTPVSVENPGGGRIQDKRDPAPGDLVVVRGVGGKRVQLHRLAADAWQALVRSAREEGIGEPLLLPNSGYRSTKRQAALFRAAEKKYGSKHEARKWVAPPGGSAHHSGRAIDFYLGGKNSSGNVAALRRKPAYLWLKEYAERFGFYPYEREPWHWEYNPPASAQERERVFEDFPFEEPEWSVEKDRPFVESEEETEDTGTDYEDRFQDYGTLSASDEFRDEDGTLEIEEEQTAFSGDADFIPEEPLIAGKESLEDEQQERDYSLDEAEYPEDESTLAEEFLNEEFVIEEDEGVDLEFEVSVPGDVNKFATKLGSEWAKRRNGSPSAEQITQWLLQDYRDTLDGARKRYGQKYNKGKFTEDAIGRAWMISRQEQMEFKTASGGLKPLRNFAPPTDRVALVSSDLIEGSDKAPVAPIIVQFVNELRRRYSKSLGISTYRGHGGGKFNNRGYSLDFFLKGVDARGFYQSQEAIAFLRALDQAAAAVRTAWRVIYNDFSVGNTINRETGYEHVIFVGTVRRDGNKRVTGLNWHGPDPLILHLHLDITPVGMPVGTGRSVSSAPSVPSAGTSLSSLPEKLAQAVRKGVFSIQVASAFLFGDRDEGRLTNMIFSARHPERDPKKKIQPHEKQLAREWLDIRDRIVRPMLKTLSGTPGPARPSAPKDSNAVVAKIDRYREIIQREAARTGVDADIISGIIAAESGGDPQKTAPSGYKGLMQAATDNAQFDPEVSIRTGAEKFKQFRDMNLGPRLRKFGIDIRSVDKHTMVRWVVTAYNAGHVTVLKAVEYAEKAGNRNAWMEAEHYQRALLFSGGYSIKTAAKSYFEGRSSDALAQELATLSGSTVQNVKNRYSTAEGLNTSAIKTAIIKHAEGEWNRLRFSKRCKNWQSCADPPAGVWTSLSGLLKHSVKFKHNRTPGYVDKIIRYMTIFERRR